MSFEEWRGPLAIVMVLLAIFWMYVFGRVSQRWTKKEEKTKGRAFVVFILAWFFGMPYLVMEVL